MKKRRSGNIRKVILIFLTIVIVGPLVFFGSCLPIGMLGFEMGTGIGAIIMYLAWVIGFVLAIWVVCIRIKKITRINKMPTNSKTNKRK